jgi:hypothetical protein
VAKYGAPSSGKVSKTARHFGHCCHRSRCPLDLTRQENAPVWERLHELEPERSRIEQFDMVWWMYFSPRRGGEAP